MPNKMNVPNLKAESAFAYGPSCLGCIATKTDVMLSFGSVVPYGGDNKPCGEIDSLKIVDVFMSRTTAEDLYEELKSVLNK